MTKINKTIPNEVLIQLLDKIESEAREAVQCGETETTFSTEIGEWYFEGKVESNTTEQDDSFSHEFGYKESYSLKYRSIDDIDITTCCWSEFDEEGAVIEDYEVDMDYTRLFKLLEDKANGVFQKMDCLVNGFLKTLNTIAS